MRRARALVLLGMSAVAMATRGAEGVRIDITPKGPVNLDDVIVLTVTTLGGRAHTVVEIDATNCVVSREESRVIDEQTATEQETYFVVPLTTGRLELKPRSAYSRTAYPVIGIDVRPDLGRSSNDIATVFARQRRQGRIPGVLRAVPSKSKIYVGERVEVHWKLIMPDLNIIGNGHRFATSTDSWSPLDVDGGYDSTGHTEERRTAIGGEFVVEREGGAIAFSRSEPGIVSIPARYVRGTIRDRQTDTERPFVQWSEALTIEVLPPPAAAGSLPFGRFSLQCEEARDGYWPAARVTLQGTSGAMRAAAPDFVVPPQSTILIVPQRAEANVAEWRYEVHDQNPKLPPLESRYYDPDTNRVETARCPGMALAYRPQQNVHGTIELRDAQPVAPPDSAPTQERVDLPGLDPMEPLSEAWTRWILYITGALAVLGMFLIVRALVD